MMGILYTKRGQTRSQKSGECCIAPVIGFCVWYAGVYSTLRFGLYQLFTLFLFVARN